MTHATTSTASSTAATATSASTSAGRGTATVLATAGTLCTGSVALGVSLRSTGKLDGDLALKDGLAVELGNGALGLGGGGESNEGVADGAGGARVGGDGNGLAVEG